MAKFTNAPWDGAASNYKDTDAYCAACLVDTNPRGKPKIQANCKLPYKMPDGTISLAALRAGLARGDQVTGIPDAVRRAAMAKARNLLAQGKKALNL